MVLLNGGRKEGRQNVLFNDAFNTSLSTWNHSLSDMDLPSLYLMATWIADSWTISAYPILYKLNLIFSW